MATLPTLPGRQLHNDPLIADATSRRLVGHLTNPHPPRGEKSPRPISNAPRIKSKHATVTLPTLRLNRAQRQYPLKALSAWYEQAWDTHTLSALEPDDVLLEVLTKVKPAL